MKIGIIVGSLRKESFNRKIAKVLIKNAPATDDIKIIEISELPFFNQDLESTPPAAWVAFRKTIQSLDAVIFVTPEYNRSMPAALKNAIDVGSRPYGQSSWKGKPAGIVSASIGAIGGFGANHHLRQSLVFLDMPCLQQPEVYLSAVDKMFDEQGTFNPDTEKFLKTFLTAFQDFIAKNHE